MSWRQLLTRELTATYGVTEKLMDLVDDGALGWKPSQGSNWMTAGQLLMHLTNACGACFKGFVTGDWGMPEEADPNAAPSDGMLPPAEKLPAVTSVAEAKKLLAEDRALAFDMLAKTSDAELAEKKLSAPWSPVEMVLGHHLLMMVDHLKAHKGQLFYYLKLQGKPVHTGNLWGM